MSTKLLQLILFAMLILLLAACQPAPATPETVVETLVVAEDVTATPVEVIQVVTPTPEPTGSRTLVICVAEEPDRQYFFYTNSTTQTKFQELIEDGPIDSNSFGYQPVILEKLPSLADGDAVLTTVTVSEGDTIVDASGEVVVLDAAADPPTRLIPAGGGDQVPYQNGDIEMEQLSVTFKLLPDLYWSDGHPLTAQDSVYPFNLFFDDWWANRTAAYEAIDERTILWVGVPGFLDSSYPTYLIRPHPMHIWQAYSPVDMLDIAEAKELYTTTIGWGPYMIEEWVEGESISLRKNPNYFRAGEGLPKFDKVIYRITGDNSNTNIAAILSGECDIVSANLDDQVELLSELHQAGKLKATFTTGTIWEHLDFGIQHLDYDDGYQIGIDRPDFFSDVRTRRAFAMCLDRQALVDTIFYGQSMVPDSYVPHQHPLYNPEIHHYEFDVTAGSALLEEVGWVDDDGDAGTPRVAQDVANIPDGTLLEVDYETTSGVFRQQITSILKDSLAQCGIKANVQLYSPDEWFGIGPEGKLFGRRYDLGQFVTLVDPDPACDIYMSNQTPGPIGETWISIQDGVERTFQQELWLGNNQIGFANEDYDQACSMALSSLPGESEYETGHLEAQRIFSEQLPSVPLFYRIKVTATRPDMCGVIMDPSGFSEFWNVEKFDYGEGCEE